MRLFKSVAACAVTLTTFALAAIVSAGPAVAGVANPPPAPPLTFPTIQLNTEPSGVAVDPSTHMVYVANPQSDGNGLVSVIDAADHYSPPVLLEQLPVPGDPTAIGVDASTHVVYVADDNGLTMVNGATTPPTVGSTIPLGNDLPGQVAVDPTTHTVYVTEFGANDVKVVNTAVNPPTVTTIGYPEIVDTPLGVAVDPTTHLAYVTEINDDLLAVIDGADNPPQVVHTIHLGDPATFNNGGADPDAVGVDPTTHTVYVANGNGTVQVINGYEITAGLRLGSYPGSYPDGIAVDPTSHTAYVTDGVADTVSVVSGTQNPPAVTGALPVGDFPLGIGIDPSTHTVFVANHSDTTISVVGPPTIIATPPVNSLPEGITRRLYTTTENAYGGGGTYTWTAANLPVGLSISPTTGTIGGYPAEAGVSQVTVTVTAPLGSASSTFSLTIANPPRTTPCGPGKCV